MSSLPALADAGQAAWDRGEFDLCERLARELIARASEQGDLAKVALGYRLVGAARVNFHDEKGAKDALYQALQLFSEIGDHVGAANVMLSLGTLAIELNMDVNEAHGLYEEALSLLRAHGDKSRIGVALGNLGEVYRQEGDYRRAMQAATESLAIFQELGDDARAGWQLTNIATLHVLRRNDEPAVTFLDRAYEALQRGGNTKWYAIYFDVWFMLATRLERWELAALLEGFMDHFRDEHHLSRLLGLIPWYAPCVERLYASIPPSRIDELRERGAHLSIEEAKELTLSIRRGDDVASA